MEKVKNYLQATFSSCSIPIPLKRITVNLLSANIQKEGASLNLAIAPEMPAGTKQIKPPKNQKRIFLREIDLTSTIRPVKGVVDQLKRIKKGRVYSRYCAREKSCLKSTHY